MHSLGFIKCTCGSFSDSSSLITIYCFLVRFILEYCLMIWMNNTIKQNVIIGSVQNNS